jgi:ribonuclease-3
MIDQVERAIGYRFKDEKLLLVAFTHASSAETRQASNERLEFLGDSVLGFVVCELLFSKFPDLLEGDLTKIKSAVVSRSTCAQIAQKLELASVLQLGKGMNLRENLPQSVLAAAFESLVAALYLDGGIDIARPFIIAQMSPYIDASAASTHQENFKSVLQQYAQRHLTFNPVYHVVGSRGPDHLKTFEVRASLGEQMFGSAFANSKKEAEQAAALRALEELGLATRSPDGIVTLHPLSQS